MSSYKCGLLVVMLPSISQPAAATQQLTLTAPLVILALPITFLPRLLPSPLPQLLLTDHAIVERLRREKNGQRAAAHQAAQAKATAPVPSPVPVTIPVTAATSTDSVKAASSTGPGTSASSAIDSMTSASSTASVVSKESESSSSLHFKCDQCNFTSNSDKGLKTHTRMKHRISQLDGHEEESELYRNPCPLCHEAEVCHCGDCEE